MTDTVGNGGRVAGSSSAILNISYFHKVIPCLSITQLYSSVIYLFIHSIEKDFVSFFT
jgi:hypothetical protein